MECIVGSRQAEPADALPSADYELLKRGATLLEGGEV